MGFERNYQIKNLSKQLNIKQFSTFHTYSKLNPSFISGLIDGEGCFVILIYKNKELKLGWRVKAWFQINLHSRDIELLLLIQEFFGNIGTISSRKNKNTTIYTVTSIKELKNTIIPHFEKYPLQTQKAADFILFKQIVEQMSNQVHLTKEGLQQIINIRSSMNLGLSELQIGEFPKNIPVARPIIIPTEIPDPNWIAGFATGESCFFVGILKSKSNKIGYAVNLRFRIGQHDKDKKLLELISNYLDCGKIYKHSEHVFFLVIQKFFEIKNIIIPFFEKHKILGIKQKDYQDFFKVANLMTEGKHLTTDGLEKIQFIKANMNTQRKIPKI